MKRIPEPELMNDYKQALAYAEADFGDAHSRFIKLFSDVFGNENIAGYVLDLGCGPGDITIRFARTYSDCIIHGIDGSEAMLHYGRKILDKENNVKDRITLIKGTLPEAIIALKKYDIIISNSLLHHLQDPLILWKTVKDYTKQNSIVFIMDLFRPESRDEAKALVEKYSSEEPEILRHDFYNSLLASFNIEEINIQLKEAGLDYLSVNVVSDRHITVYGHIK